MDATQRNTTFLKHISTIQRCTMRYFETALAGLSGCSIGYGQQFFLLRISEHEGISLQELAHRGNYDKATVTKAVQKLAACGLITVEPDDRDRRIRRLYLTSQARELTARIYDIRDSWRDRLIEGFDDNEKRQVEELLGKMALRAWELTEKGGNHS